MGAMEAVEIITKSAKETQKAGSALAVAIGRESIVADRALIITFEGDLGAGKTTFIQGFAQGLGVKESVLSPTFVIQKDFSIALGEYKNFYHIDAYRLKNPGELLELGFEDLVENSENIIAIEWADKVKSILPSDVIGINFESLGGDKRKININYIND